MSAGIITCEGCGSDDIKPLAVPGMFGCERCGKAVVLEPAEQKRVKKAKSVASPRPLAGNPAPMPLHAGERVELPDATTTELLSGWRAWLVTEEHGTPLLTSVIRRREFWMPGEPVQAKCRKCPEPPMRSHTCGLYSALNLSHLLGMTYPQYANLPKVVGEVAVWGKVIEGSLGWRAQFGYPRTLYVPFEASHLIEPLTDAYRVPVRPMNWLKKGS